MLPATCFAGVIPPHARASEAGPVKLEKRGLTSHWQQGALFEQNTIWKDSIAAKLKESGNDDLAEPLRNCHTLQSFARCNGCRAVRTFWNRCDLFYCPTCQTRLTAERRESVEWWTKQVNQPKHVVLTTRNTEVLTFAMVKAFKENLTRLRRSKLARNWHGGMWSLEVTNEGKGWHLHAHLLVDSPWIDASALSIKWGELVGQDYAIVCVKDCRSKSYLQEVTKYAVKGSMLAAWKPDDVLQFVLAFKGQRCFGVFGSLYGKRTEWREWLTSLRTHTNACECGCSKWSIYSKSEWDWLEETAAPIFSPRPPPESKAQLALGV